MSTLASISKPEKRPPIMTLCGDAGTGKTSLAATFPNPIFIRAEDGVGRIDATISAPDCFPVIRDAEDVYNQLMALLSEQHDYQTLVIDSTTALDGYFTADILKRDGRAKTLSTALGGYGAGYDALAAMHGRVRKAAGLLNERKGMTVIFIAHADLETMRLPDVDDYQRWSLRLSKKSMTHYVDDVDMVGYVRLVSALKGGEGDRKKVVSNGDRELICHATAASVSKNGLGITEPLDCAPGQNPLAPYLGIRTAKAAKKAKPEPVEREAPAEQNNTVEQETSSEVEQA